MIEAEFTVVTCSLMHHRELVERVVIDMDSTAYKI